MKVETEPNTKYLYGIAWWLRSLRISHNPPVVGVKTNNFNAGFRGRRTLD